MNKIILSLTVILCCAGIEGFAQCGKKILLTASKTEYLDTAGNVTRSVEEKSTIEIKEKEIIISPGTNPPMIGSFTVESCAWPSAFKKGKSVYNAHFESSGQEAKDVAIIIEAKDGRLVFIGKVKDQPHKTIRLYPDKFEELK
ncbi:MAG: hypothetical protein ACTHMM_26640 [Agriterribacter sp.]